MSGSVRTCCVPKCGRTRTEGTMLYSFPHPEKDAERFITWVNAVGSSISCLDHEYIYKNRKICSDHFDNKSKTWKGRLSNIAVPTLLMPGFRILPNVPMRDITNVDVQTYCNKSSIASTSVGSEVQPVVMDIDISSNNNIHKMSSTLSVTSIKGDKAVLARMLKKATKKNDRYAARLKKALNLSENRTFQKILSKFTSLAAIFTAMQFREIGKKNIARRFTKDEKVMALSLYKYGPRLYRFMSKVFVLPSPLTLNRLVARANVQAGINENLFNVLKEKIKKMKSDDKLCILIFDEMAISPHFDFNLRKDTINGFVTDGKIKDKKIADHALVFMIRGVLRNYKQTIAYTFCCGSTKKYQLATLLEEVIKKLHSVGLRVLATVCDQGTSNVSCINHLINQTKVKYLKENKKITRAIFEIENKEIIPLYDPPHLLKGIRNNLLTKHLQCSLDGETKTAKWEHLIQLHKEDPGFMGIRLLKNLTDEHIQPEKLKMKVKYATQIFSQKVAVTMGYLADKGILPEECKETAEILFFFDQLFDSVYGSYDNSKKRGKILLDAVKPGSAHNGIWAKSKKVLSTMKFLKNGKVVSIPTISNWLHTLNNIEHIRDILFREYNIKSFWMRHFNQDPLENFFGCIRSHGCRNVYPIPESFECAYASLLITNLTGTHSPGYNCEQDSCSTMFKSMQELFKFDLNQKSTSQNLDLSYIDSNIFIDYKQKKEIPQVYAQLQYVTGYLLKKTRINVFRNCVLCKNDFYSSTKSDYILAREYNRKKTTLQYPNEQFIASFSRMQDIIMWVLKNHSNIENLKNYVKTLYYIEINTDFTKCKIHKIENVEYIFNLVIKFFIYNWCKDINNILRGRRKNTICDDDYMKKCAQEYFNKRKK